MEAVPLDSVVVTFIGFPSGVVAVNVFRGDEGAGEVEVGVDEEVEVGVDEVFVSVLPTSVLEVPYLS